MSNASPSEILESDDPAAALSALSWLVEAGADEVVGELALDRYESSASQAQASETKQRAPRQASAQQAGAAPAGFDPSGAPPVWTPEAETPQSLDGILAEARKQAAAAQTLEELQEAIINFDGCALKKTAKNTVIYRGNPEAKLMLIGEAPRSEEDLQGKPFAGKTGQLLDAMLATIGLDDTQVYITNMLFWRPPGDRTAHPNEILLCQPFVERQIELLAPSHLLLLGNISAKSLLAEKQSINKLRGRWRHYQHEGLTAPIPALPLYHPVFLINQPAQKREAWRDLLAFKRVISGQEEPKIKG